jgi:hypothetical protein
MDGVTGVRPRKGSEGTMATRIIEAETVSMCHVCGTIIRIYRRAGQLVDLRHPRGDCLRAIVEPVRGRQDVYDVRGDNGRTPFELPWLK